MMLDFECRGFFSPGVCSGRSCVLCSLQDVAITCRSHSTVLSLCHTEEWQTWARARGSWAESSLPHTLGSWQPCSQCTLRLQPCSKPDLQLWPPSNTRKLKGSFLWVGFSAAPAEHHQIEFSAGQSSASPADFFMSHLLLLLPPGRGGLALSLAE